MKKQNDYENNGLTERTDYDDRVISETCKEIFYLSKKELRKKLKKHKNGCIAKLLINGKFDLNIKQNKSKKEGGKI